MKKSVRLQPVCKLKQQQERKEATQLAKYQGELEQSRRQLNELQQYLQDYYQNLQGHQGSVRSASQLGLYQSFVSRLQKAIARQGEMVKQRELSVKAQTQRWIKASHSVKVMEQLIEQARQEEAREEGRREQKMMDDRPFRSPSGFN